MADHLTAPVPPKSLRTAGRACWKAIHAELSGGMVLDERERLILRQCCDTADDLDRLEEMLGVCVKPTEELRVLSERRQQRLAYGRLLAQLDLGDQNVAIRPASRRAQHAARARWGPGVSAG